jgi:hypothetical protein
MNEARGVTLPELGSFSAEERATAARRICFSGEDAAIEIAKEDPKRFVTISIDCQQELFRRESQLTASLEREAKLIEWKDKASALVDDLALKWLAEGKRADALEAQLAAAQNAALTRENEQSAMDAATVEERFELRERLKVCEKALEMAVDDLRDVDKKLKLDGDGTTVANYLDDARAELAKEKANG